CIGAIRLRSFVPDSLVNNAPTDAIGDLARLCGALSGLGLDLFRHSPGHRFHPAISHGRFPLFHRRIDSLRYGTGARCNTTARHHVAQLSYRRWIFAARRKWRRHHFRTIYRYWAGGGDCRDGTDLHRAALVGDRRNPASETPGFAWTNGRIGWRRNSNGALDALFS